LKVVFDLAKDVNKIEFTVILMWYWFESSHVFRQVWVVKARENSRNWFKKTKCVDASSSLEGKKRKEKSEILRGMSEVGGGETRGGVNFWG